jgi:hypothetical protein
VIEMRFDDAAFRRQLTNLETTQLPFASAQALNDTAAEILAEVQDRMKAQFDRPTRFALNAFMVWRATKAKLVAEVKERPSVGRRHFLKVQEAGGARPQTGLDKGFATRLAYEGIIQAVAPASGARLDAFGNWSSGERNQVLSALGAQRDATANSTVGSRKRAKGRASYFVPRNGGLSPGVYKRTAPGAEPVKVLHFLDAAPRYQKRLGFMDQVAETWTQRFPAHLDRRLAEAVATAR